MRVTIGLSLLLIAVLLAGCAPEPVSTPDPGQPPAWVTVHPTVTAVVLATPTPITLPTPAPSDRPAIYDCQGERSEYPWLYETYGSVTWLPAFAADAPFLEALHPCCGDCPAAVVVQVLRGGAAAPNVTVVWSWPEAPLLPDELRHCDMERGIWGITNSQGLIGFAMGGGAYYSPPAGGPHSLWLPSGACLFGLGMLAGTNHRHVDVQYTLPDLWIDSVGDWGFTAGTLYYERMIAGRPVTVVVWPAEGEAP